MKKKLIIMFTVICFLISTTNVFAFYNISDATSIYVNSEITGSIRYQTERNLYNIHPTGYGPVEIELEYPAEVNKVSWRIVVITGGSYQVFNEKNSPDDPIINGKKVHKMKTVRTSSALHVIITSYENLNTSEYTLRIKQTHESTSNTETEFANNSINFCRTIKSNTDYKANLYNKWDVDFFNFKVTEEKNVSVKVCNPSLEGSFMLEAINDKLEVLVSSYISAETAEQAIDVGTLTPGSYFIKIYSGDKYTNSDYTFNIIHK